MHILLSGFEPFGGSDRNPSAEVVATLATTPPAGTSLTPLVLPVETDVAATRLLEAVEVHAPEAVVMLGEAAGRAAITPELVAINLRDFPIADNAGRRLAGEPLVPGGPDAHFATLPIDRLIDASNAAGTPARRSLSAGTYLCNEVSYRVLHAASVAGDDLRAGFIHVPRLPEQVPTDGGPTASMSLDTTVRGVRAMLEALATPPVDSA